MLVLCSDQASGGVWCLGEGYLFEQTPRPMDPEKHDPRGFHPWSTIEPGTFWRVPFDVLWRGHIEDIWGK